MCGILSILNFDPENCIDPASLGRMTETMVHRRSDDLGYWVHASVGLGYLRLAIIDLSLAGHQPMSNKDGTIWITYNGESYNFKELQRELEEKGDQFKSNTDTEMWLRLLENINIGRLPEKLVKGRYFPDQGSRNKKLHDIEAQDMYTQVFKEPGVAGIFPELAESAEDPKVIAKAYMWLRDTMSIHRGWYAFADEQYIRAIALDPSWNNPARMKRVINYVRRLLRPGYRFIRHGLGSAFRRGNFEV
jgi:hypothetical protein